MPSFRRRAATPWTSAPIATIVPFILTVASACTPQLFLLVDEDDDVSPGDGGIRPHKRRAIDAGGEMLMVVDSNEGDFIL